MVIEVEKYPDGTLALSPDQRKLLLSRGHSRENVYSALLRLYAVSPQRGYSPARESNLPPCPDCGGEDFIPTGNCHACARCGVSQGCS